MNSSPNSSPRPVLRGAFAAQAVAYTPDALTDLPPVPAESPSPVTPSPASAASAAPSGHSAPSSVAASAAEGLGRPSAGVSFDEVYAEQMAALREEAHAEGFTTGHAEGMRAAEDAIAEMVEQARQQVAAEQDAWRAQAQATLTALAAAADALDTRTAPTLSEMTDSLAAAAFTLVSDLFERELALATDPGRDAVERALRLVPADQPVVVHLNPADHAALDPAWVATVGSRVTLVADASVETAGAVAQAGSRRVDAQLSTALARVRGVLDA